MVTVFSQSVFCLIEQDYETPASSDTQTEFLLLTYILNNRHTSVKGRKHHGCIYILLNTVLATDVNKYSLTTASCKQRWQTNWIHFDLCLAAKQRTVGCLGRPITTKQQSMFWSVNQSQSDNMCTVPRTHNSFGDRSFGAVSPRIWNSLPCNLRTPDISYKHFKALLKTYMFQQGHGAL